MLRAHKNKQSRDTGQTVGGFRRILLRQRRYPSYMAIRSQSTIAFFRSRPAKPMPKSGFDGKRVTAPKHFEKK